MKNIKLNAFTNMLVRILNIVFPLITGPYISRVLSKEDFGNFNVANTILNLFRSLHLGFTITECVRLVK